MGVPDLGVPNLAHTTLSAEQNAYSAIKQSGLSICFLRGFVVKRVVGKFFAI